jgi:hypothetical protein
MEFIDRVALQKEAQLIKDGSKRMHTNLVYEFILTGPAK